MNKPQERNRQKEKKCQEKKDNQEMSVSMADLEE